jgi:uncharacterized protein (DUF58 family)
VSHRITRLGVSLLSLLALALFVGVLSGRVELFLVAAPLALGLFGGMRRPAPLVTVTHEVSATRLFEGERTTVTVTLTAADGAPQLEVLEPLPPSAELLSGSNRTVVAVRAGKPVRWSYELRLPERGRIVLGTLYLRAWDPMGLAVSERVHHDPKVIRVYPPATPVRRVPVPLRTQTSAGNYVSPLVGEGLEPGEIRPFASGDRIKHVNWRASLRLGRLFVTRYHQERNADVVLMLDTLSQAGAGAATTVGASLRGAASLAAAYLARKDRVGLIEYGGVLRWVKPGSGRAHFERLLDTLLRADVTFTYVAKDLGLVPPRVLPSQALVIALSPLLDPRFTAAAIDLAGRGFDLIVVAVDPVDVTRAVSRRDLLGETAGRVWRLERRVQLAELRSRGLRVVEWDPEESIELALARAGRSRPGRALV